MDNGLADGGQTQKGASMVRWSGWMEGQDLTLESSLSLVWVLRAILITALRCTQIVSCLTNFEDGEEDAVEEAEEGELEEEGGDSEEIDLVLELSADLD